MVLKLWEAKVKDTRESTVLLDGQVPQAIEWSGEALNGQTTAVVPLDSVMPRSRAAQAAYAMQLYDREIITTPAALAKVADLPDQDDLVAGIDPDSARAMRENLWMAVGVPRTVAPYDNDANHLRILRDFQCSERFELLDEETQQIYYDHGDAHEIAAAQKAAAQAQAAMMSPIAAALPTAEEKALPIDDLAAAQEFSAMTPTGGALTPDGEAMAAQQGQMPGPGAMAGPEQSIADAGIPEGGEEPPMQGAPYG